MPSSGTGSSSSETAAGSALRDLLPKEIAEAGTLEAGVAPVFAPATFYPPGTKDLQGFDPEILTALADVLGLKVNFTALGFEGLITGVASDRFQVAATGITDTPERQKQVSFVDYMADRKVFVTTADNKAGISGELTSICGKKLAVQKATVDHDYLRLIKEACSKAGQPAPKDTVYPDSAAKKLAVQSRRVDVSFYSTMDVPALQKESGNKFAAFVANDLPAGLLGIAVDKDSEQLQQAVLAGMSALMENGTYAKILEKWGVSGNAIDKASLNEGVAAE